jgi:hypothetical protein
MANFLKSLFVKGVEIDPAGATSNQVLKYNGTKFVPGTASTVGSIDDLSDVVITSPTDGQVLKYNTATSLWTNASAGGGASITVSDTPPVSPTAGALWYESDSGKTFIYYDSQWIEIGGGIKGDTGPVGPSFESTFAYKVGDTGPGGGIIFFVDRFNEYPDFTYLEVAPVSTEVQRTWATNVFSNQSFAASGANSKALGGGYQNTLDIVAQFGNVAATCAGVYCDALVSGGQSDWYLPSLGELKLVHDVVNYYLNSGSFTFSSYWSSSQNGSSSAFTQVVNGGYQNTGSKGAANYVRPVRRF